MNSYDSTVQSFPDTANLFALVYKTSRSKINIVKSNAHLYITNLKNITNMPKNVSLWFWGKTVYIIMVNNIVLINTYLYMYNCRYSTQRFKARKHSFGGGPK